MNKLSRTEREDEDNPDIKDKDKVIKEFIVGPSKFTNLHDRMSYNSRANTNKNSMTSTKGGRKTESSTKTDPKHEPIKIPLSSIQNLRIINGKVPAIELEYTGKDKEIESVFFSMMSDYNVQETLVQLKRLKKEGRLLEKKKRDDKIKKKREEEKKL